jgi:hypothetical protein
VGWLEGAGGGNHGKSGLLHQIIKFTVASEGAGEVAAQWIIQGTDSL